MSMYIAVWLPPREEGRDGPLVLGVHANDRDDAETKIIERLRDHIKDAAADSDVRLGQLYLGLVVGGADGVTTFNMDEVDLELHGLGFDEEDE
jgi:hypothetical protein